VDNQQLLSFVEEALSLAPGSIQENTVLEGLDGWDSIGIISVMAVIEDHCGISPDPVELAKCKSAGDLVRLILDNMKSS
jgi:acyl carrier protein